MDQFSMRSTNTWLLVLSQSSSSCAILVAHVKAPSFPYCPQCGTWNPPSAQFCMRCGTPLDSTSADHRQPWINRPSGSPYQGVVFGLWRCSLIRSSSLSSAFLLCLQVRFPLYSVRRPVNSHYLSYFGCCSRSTWSLRSHTSRCSRGDMAKLLAKKPYI